VSAKLHFTPRPLYGITRIDQPKRSFHGYNVRLRHGQDAYARFFADRKHGGKRKALRLAQAYRDEVLATMPKQKQEAAARKIRKTPKSGVTGVTHVITPRTGTSRYAYWQASWNDEHGKRRTAKFSIQRYGKEEALDMAIKARAKALREVAKILKQQKAPRP